MKIKNKVKSFVSRTVGRLVRRSSIFRETEVKLFQARDRASRIESENRNLADLIQEIGGRLCNYSVQWPTDPMRRSVCVVIEIDAMILERGVLCEDDDKMLGYIGRGIAAKVKNEICRATSGCDGQIGIASQSLKKLQL